MAQDTPETAAPAAKRSAPDRIYLVSYPKIVFMYPTFVASVLTGLYMLFAGGDTETMGSHVAAVVFLGILAANLMVLGFDFPRTTSLTLLFFVIAVAFGLWMLFTLNKDLLPQVTRVLRQINPHANATFYFVIAAVFTLIFIGVFIGTHFDYWEIRHNELLHHHGVLSDLKRYSAPHLRIDKEINDIFEYMLLRS